MRQARKGEAQQQLVPAFSLHEHIVGCGRKRNPPTGELLLHFGKLIRSQRIREQRHLRRVPDDAENNRRKTDDERHGADCAPRATRESAPASEQRYGLQLDLHSENRLQRLRRTLGAGNRYRERDVGARALVHGLLQIARPGGKRIFGAFRTFENAGESVDDLRET